MSSRSSTDTGTTEATNSSSYTTESKATENLETITSDETNYCEKETSSADPLDTSYGLRSLASNEDDFDVNLDTEDANYMSAVHYYMVKEPVFRRRHKIKVVRRLQVAVKSCVGYTQLFREWRRRRNDQEFEDEIQD